MKAEKKLAIFLVIKLTEWSFDIIIPLFSYIASSSEPLPPSRNLLRKESTAPCGFNLFVIT